MSNQKLIYISVERQEAAAVAKFLKRNDDAFRKFCEDELIEVSHPASFCVLDSALDVFREDWPTEEQRAATLADDSISEDQKCHRLLDIKSIPPGALPNRIDLLIEEAEQAQAELDRISSEAEDREF